MGWPFGGRKESSRSEGGGAHWVDPYTYEEKSEIAEVINKACTDQLTKKALRFFTGERRMRLT